MSGGSYLVLGGVFLVVLGGRGRWRMGQLLAKSKEDQSAGILETVKREGDRRDIELIGHLDQRIMYARVASDRRVRDPDPSGWSVAQLGGSETRLGLGDPSGP